VSAIRILVLGVVHQHGQAHGYQVRRELLGRRADLWAKVAPGSIYQALKTLAKHGLLEHVATEPGTAGPERAVYRITPDGETEYFHQLRLAITGPDRDQGPESLNAAFAFLHLLGRTEVADLLGYRVRALRARLVELAPTTPDPFRDGTPPQVAALGELYRARLQADVDWSVELADRIRSGAYAFADDTSQA
jgi:DNA-binding PadR family transcriptional regulator